MRKLLSLCVIVALVLVVGCSFTQPQKTVVLNLAAQNCGFLLAQENFPLALEIRNWSEYVLNIEHGNIEETTFHRWAEVVIEHLKLDPFLEMNFKEMLKLVDIEITLAENQKEITKLVYGVIESFIAGIRAKG